MSDKGSISAVIVKANAGFECQECGSNELVSSHHQAPSDDSTQICLCASCHADKHLEVPRALFFSNNGHWYWFNKPAAQLAREVGVCSRTIVRVAKKLGIVPGELSPMDEALLVGNLNISKRLKNKVYLETLRKTRVDKRLARQSLLDELSELKEVYCPYCRSGKPMRKAGFTIDRRDKRHQRYECKKCRRFTMKPKKGGK